MITVDLRTFYDIIYRKAFSGGDNLEKVDGRKNNGGHRKGSGRPKLMPGESKQRGIHMIRAFDDEYKIIKRFISLVRKDRSRCEAALKILELK